MTQEAPSLSVKSLGCQPAPGDDQWRCSFELTNQGRMPLEVLSTWLPHDRFFDERRQLDRPLMLETHGKSQLEVRVTFAERPGAAVVNAFLILQVKSKDQGWRVFARLLPTAQEDGAPSLVCEAVSVQPVGFSTAEQPG